MKKILSDPKTIIAGVVAGFLFGHYFKVEAQYLKPFADIYISLLSMCMLPIMVSALTWGIAQLLRNPKTADLFKAVGSVGRAFMAIEKAAFEMG